MHASLEEQQSALARAASHRQRPVVQWFEAAIKVHDEQTVARMLTESPEILTHDHNCDGATALHIAAKYDHDRIVAQLLAEDPTYADDCDDEGWNAFLTAADNCSENAVAVFLEKTPHVIDSRDGYGQTALHLASTFSDKVVAQLLAANPKLVNKVGVGGWTPIHRAAEHGQEAILDMLLAVNPQLIFLVLASGETVLHLACRSPARNKAFFTRLLGLNPGALRAVDYYSNTPLDLAVSKDNDSAIEVLLQSELTFEEIASAFTKHNKSFEGRLKPIVERQCACLVEASSLNRDVVNIMFEYLGFQMKGGFA